MNHPIVLRVPFIWPEPQISAGMASYPTQLPFETVASSTKSIFGVVSALDAQAVDWMEGYLTNNEFTKLRLVISIHPTCRTTEADLTNLLKLVEQHGDRAAFRVFPETSLLSRSSNLLCLYGIDGNTTITIGPTENMGFTDGSPSQANLVCTVTAATLEVCRRWFDYLWGSSGPLRSEVATTLPHLVLPKGDEEASQLWNTYRELCLANGLSSDLSIYVIIDPDTGDVVLKDQNDQLIQSPTEEIGIAKLDALADDIARVFELGALVTVDKTSRIPPLEAPVKPEWFGVDSFHQTGMVRAQTSIKVAPFDETTLKKIDRLRRVSGDLLPRYSFALADGVRWMPKKAVPLFEAALTVANDEAKKLLGETVGDNIDDFLTKQRERIRADAQRMYEAYHPGGIIPDDAVKNIMEELKGRLGKTRNEALIPKVSYSQVAFNPGQSSQWSSPWGQAFQLLKGIVEFPREAMTNRYFWQGARINDEDELVKAMNVAEDHLVKEYGSRKAKQQSEQELALVKALEVSTAEVREKCEALWSLIKTGNDTMATQLLTVTNVGHTEKNSEAQNA